MIARRSLLIGAPAGPLAACAWTPPQTAALRTRAAGDLPPRIELHETPFFAQTHLQCGPAALATVLGALGLAVEPDAIAKQVFVPARQGSLQVELLAAARRHGAFAVVLPGQLTAVLGELSQRRPVLVLQNLGLSFVPAWHYAVLVGHDLEQEEVVLRSGTTKRQVFGMRTFEHTWARAEHWAFVALKPGELPRSASEAAVSDACMAFERVAAPPSAVRAYEAAAARWPANLLLEMGLGNARHAVGDIAGAARAYAGAAERHDSAAAWNNLALARARLGERAGARIAALRAVARAQAAEPQWLAAARDTLAGLQ